MTLLLRPHATDDEAPTRSRYWYEYLWKKAPKRRYTQAEAAAIVAANWDRTAKQIRSSGVRLP